MKKFLGIDVGGTKVKYGVFNEHGEEIHSGLVDTERDNLNSFIETIVNIKNFYGHIDGIGVSLPCVLNPDSGEILECGNITALHKVNIKKLLEDRLNIRVEIENDGNCVALAEKWIGNGKDNSNFICVTIGTGIGGAIIINDRIYKGNNFVAGEFGFMLINDLGNKDYGHLASTSALVNRVSELKGKMVDGHYIFNGLSEGDCEILNVYDTWMTSLAIGIRNLCFILDPEKVLIGGGVSAQGRVVDDLRRKLSLIMPEGYDLWSIECCKFYNQSGMLGAVYNYIERSVKPM
ncbi:MAG: ROK family protein [Clostridium sp.]